MRFTTESGTYEVTYQPLIRYVDGRDGPTEHLASRLFVPVASISTIAVGSRVQVGFTDGVFLITRPVLSIEE